MKTIILSAGKGERLLPLTKDRPKLLIDLGDGSTLLSRQYANLSKRHELGELVIGAGYCVSKVEEYVESLKSEMEIRVVYNPFYNASGPLVTLWVTLNRIRDTDFMFMNGDTIYSNKVYSLIDGLLADSREGIYLFCADSAETAPDDIIVRLDRDGNIEEADKNLNGSRIISAGLVFVKGESSRSAFLDVLDTVSRTEGFLSYTKTWHSFMKDLHDEGVMVAPVMIGKDDWIEIDIHFELKELQNLLIHKVANSQF